MSAITKRNVWAVVANSVAALIVVIAAGFALGITESRAGEYCHDATSCRAEVTKEVTRQNAAAASGPKWGPVGASACEIASREQEGNERRCREYDRKPGGKTWEECAKCYRQVVFDLARWEQCWRAGYAPKPPQAIYDSLARLGQSVLAYGS